MAKLKIATLEGETETGTEGEGGVAGVEGEVVERRKVDCGAMRLGIRGGQGAEGEEGSAVEWEKSTVRESRRRGFILWISDAFWLLCGKGTKYTTR